MCRPNNEIVFTSNINLILAMSGSGENQERAEKRESFCCQKTTSCCCILIGIVVFGIGCAWVSILDALRNSGAKQSAALTKDNESSWKGIPGHYDINITHKNYFYSCRNPDEVIYQGKRPIFEEFGPYSYREYQQFSNLQYDQTLNVTGLKDADFANNVDHEK